MFVTISEIRDIVESGLRMIIAVSSQVFTLYGRLKQWVWPLKLTNTIYLITLIILRVCMICLSFLFGDQCSFTITIMVTSKWPRGRLKSPTPRLFTQPFIQAQINENTEAPRHWPLWGGFTGDRWIPRTKGQWRGKCFHLMTSVQITLDEVIMAAATI